MAAPVINPEAFWKRVEALHKHWQENKDSQWGGADSVMIVAGKGEEDTTVYWNSVAAQLYLFDFELPESVMILTNDKFYYFGSSSKIKKLKDIENFDKKPATPKIHFIVKAKGDNTEQCKQLVDLVAKAGAKVGSFVKEQAFGDFAAEWMKAVDARAELEIVDVTSGLQDAMAPKDGQELRNTKVASVLNCAIMRKHVVPALQKIVDDESAMNQVAFGLEIEDRFDHPSKLNWNAVNKINTDRVDMSYPPILQSGGVYNLKPNAETQDAGLHYGTESSPGVILVSFGARYKGYNANLARTYLINPSAEQEKTYGVLVSLQAHLLQFFKPDTRVGDIMVNAKKYLEEHDAALLPHFVKNCGSGMGIIFREKHFLLNAKNDKVIREGMTFNLSIGFEKLQVADTTDEKSKTYSLLLGDTIVVKAEGAPEVLTSAASSKDDSVIWRTAQEGEDEEEAGDDLEKMRTAKAGPDQKRDQLTESAKDDRRNRQEDIAIKQREEAIRRFSKADAELAKKGKNKIAVAYESVARYPRMRNPGQIYVDSPNDSVFFPIFGVPVPIHVSFIKNISRTADANGSSVEIRINLITPGVTINADVERSFKNPKATFLRELTYKSANGTRVNANYSMINTTKKNWMQREKEKSDKQSLVQMEKIKVFRGPGAPPRLTDTTIKPPLGGRGRRTGTLEIHSNGIRYKSAQNDPLDITYQNIKYAFYQDAVNELKSEYRDDHVRIHVHLRNEIMVGKKKTKDVQFTAQIGEDNIKLSDVRRSAYDPDELEDEQRERDRRRKINNMYKKFASKIQEESKKTAFAIEFDIPYKALCFTGRASMSTSKGEVTFMPTKDCLVDLSDPPFFILDVGEVEVVYFERVTHNLKYFDVVFICKDYETWVRIDSIPSKKIETVKTWVDSVNVRYYEGEMALRWKDVLKVARTDPEGFWDEGGWDAYLGDGGGGGSGSEDSEESESDEAFSDAASDEESSDFDESEGEEESDEDEFAGEDELSEEGEDWDQAEKRLQKEDMNFKRGQEEPDERPKKKNKSRR